MALQQNNIYKQRIKINYLHTKWTRNLLVYVVLFGVFGILVFTLGKEAFRVFSTLFIISGGSFLSTFIIGFLFAIPRSNSRENNNSTIVNQDNQTTEKKSNPEKSRLETNTNLQEISDWLTKMIVGIGLTQLYKVPSLLDTLSTFLSEGFSKYPAMPAFIASSIVFFGSCGFLSGYLMTRLFLASAFALADELLDAEEYSVKYEDMDKNLKSLNDQQLDLLNQVFESNEEEKNYIISINDQNNKDKLNILRFLMTKSLVFISTIESSDKSSETFLEICLTQIAMENKEKITKENQRRSKENQRKRGTQVSSNKNPSSSNN